jgi:type IV pilus assembly protein PilC
MQFVYTTVTKNGKQEEGYIEAVSQEAAIVALQQRGFIITNITPVGGESFLSKINLFNKVKNKNIVILSRQIATLFDAKVSALRVFTLLASEIENAALGQVLKDVSESLQSGSSISSALAEHPDIFSKFYVSMVASGEESGKLPESFMYLADYLDRQYELTSKAKNALIYPSFVIGTFFAVMILMLTFVIPKISTILTESGQEIPTYTKVVLGLSSFMVEYGFIFLAMAIIGVIFVIKTFRTEAGKRTMDRLKLSIPYVGDLFQKLYLSRFADNMHTMLASGVSMVRAIEVTAAVVGNHIYEDLLFTAADEIRAGKSISDSLSQFQEVPAIMIQMIRVGEETGDLGKILKTLSDFYAREVKNAVDTLVDMIEPAMIVLLGLGVGTLLASVLIPIYNVSSGM